MSRSNRGALLLAIAVSSLLHTGYALQCWSCISDGDPDCADPFYPSRKEMTECKAQHKGEIPTCEAIVLRVNTLEVITTRSCGSVPMNGPLNISCNMQLPAHSRIERCHVCREDGCNAAAIHKITYWATALSVLIILLNGSLKHCF